MAGISKAKTVLFESGPDEELLRVECEVDKAGGLRVVQVSEGPLTQWCFEESPHAIEVVVDPVHTGELVSRCALDGPGQLPAALQVQFAGYDASHQIRCHLRELDIPYEVRENPIIR